MGGTKKRAFLQPFPVRNFRFDPPNHRTSSIVVPPKGVNAALNGGVWRISKQKNLVPR